jgi:D-alanyl-D-alanine carboxypeptidase
MKKMFIIIGIVLAVVIIAVVVLMVLSSMPIAKEKIKPEIQKQVDKAVNSKNVSQAVLMIDSPQYDISETFVAGELDGKSITADQPFHVASVGKAFTATLIGCAIDDGKLNLSDKVVEYLDAELLDNLFVVDGNDYSGEVTIQQLLSHTSGAVDYFEDEAQGSSSLKELVLSEPDKLWTPYDLLDFSRNYQKAVAAPGEKYHYSDTGYILLGFIIESVYDKTFDEVLYEKIFTPFNMDDSYLMFYSEPVNGVKPIADVWFNGVNVKDYTSLSIDWSGGGIVSTVKDLSTFVRALNNYEIVSEQTLSSLYQFDNKFMNGIHYGNGFMQYHFGEFFPLMDSLPKFVGHMGVLGTQMFYDKPTDTVYISSFGSTDYTSGSVKTMMTIIGMLERVE